MPVDEYYFAQSTGELCCRGSGHHSFFALVLTDRPDASYEFREGDPIWLELGSRAVHAFDDWIYEEGIWD